MPEAICSLLTTNKHPNISMANIHNFKWDSNIGTMYYRS